MFYDTLYNLETSEIIDTSESLTFPDVRDQRHVQIFTTLSYGFVCAQPYIFKF